MSSAPLRLGAGALLTAIVLAYGAFSWFDAEARALAAAEAAATSQLEAVAAGVASNLAAGTATEALLRDRLLDLAGDLEDELAERPGREEQTLRLFARSHRLRGAVLLDGAFEVRAAVTTVARPGGGEGPFDRDRLDRLEAAALARRAREALADGGRLVVGFDESPFSQRSEYLVGVAAPRAGGTVLLRQDTADLDRFRETAGMERLLRESAAGSGIVLLAIQTVDGRVLAASGDEALLAAWGPPGGRSGWRDGAERALDVSLAADWPGGDGTFLRVGLAAEPVLAVVAQSRRSVIVFSVLLLVTGGLGLGLLGRMERRARDEEDRLRRELDARERFAALGRLAAGVAHEVRSPLNALSMAAQRLRREAAPPGGPQRERFDELMGALRSAVKRADGTVEEFLSLGRDAAPAQPEEVELGALVAEVALAESSDAEIAAPTEAISVHADRELLARALANLLRNAREVAPPGTTEVHWHRSDDEVVIEVSDGGPGIPVAEREHVFEPFHTGRRGGTGLGLTIARDAITRTGGRIVLDAAPSGGARFAIHLPGGAT